jgi:hypothetical protein
MTLPDAIWCRRIWCRRIWCRRIWCRRIWCRRIWFSIGFFVFLLNSMTDKCRDRCESCRLHQAVSLNHSSPRQVFAAVGYGQNQIRKCCKHAPSILSHRAGSMAAPDQIFPRHWSRDYDVFNLQCGERRLLLLTRPDDGQLTRRRHPFAFVPTASSELRRRLPWFWLTARI